MNSNIKTLGQNVSITLDLQHRDSGTEERMLGQQSFLASYFLDTLIKILCQFWFGVSYIQFPITQ